MDPNTHMYADLESQDILVDGGKKQVARQYIQYDPL